MLLKENWPNKKFVVLYKLSQLVLIIDTKSGVIYRNQCGGHTCFQNEYEGVITFIEELFYDNENTVLNKISALTENVTELDINLADKIDDIFNSSYSCMMLKVDRDNLKNSMEAWIHVIIEKPPEFPLEAFDFDNKVNLYHERLELYSKYYMEVKHANQYEFYGFESTKGVLTWPNSD